MSSRNALKHGICSVTDHLLPQECTEDWTALHDAAVRRFRPADMQEYQLVFQIASLQWRMQRVTRFDTHVIRHLVDHDRPQPYAHVDDDEYAAMCTSRFELSKPQSGILGLSRLEAHLHRAWEKTVRELTFLQQTRAKQTQEADPDAAWIGFLEGKPEKVKIQNEPEPQRQIEAGKELTSSSGSRGLLRAPEPASTPSPTRPIEEQATNPCDLHLSDS